MVSPAAYQENRVPEGMALDTVRLVLPHSGMMLVVPIFTLSSIVMVRVS